MARRKRKRDGNGETFRSEVPVTVWPPTLTQQPTAFARTLNGIWGRGLSILAGAFLMGVGFFVLGGVDGILLGLVGVALVVGALAWHRMRRR